MLCIYNNRYHKIFFMISLADISEFLIANCWNVDSEPIIDPPTNDEYLRCQSNSMR